MASEHSNPADEYDEITAQLAEIAERTGGTLHLYPRPGRAVSTTVLRDNRDERGSQSETAQVEDDGTLRVLGHDQGASVSEFFGSGITSYEWVYVIAPDRIGNLLRLLGGRDGDDVLTVLAAYYERTYGAISAVLKHPDVAAEFSNWHS